MKNSLLFLALSCTISLNAQTTDNEIMQVSQKRALAEYEISVFPNPSSGAISLNAPEGSTCKVVSTKGTYIGTWQVDENGFYLDGLSVGTYIVEVELNGQKVTRRFLVI